MSSETEAAVSLRKIWQAHDERNEALGWKAGTKLYMIHGANLEQASYSGFLTIQAYFLADEAERYQGRNNELENIFYKKAERLLMLARETSGLETESPAYTIRWWKAYRHKNKEQTRKWLTEEHRVQFKHLIPEHADSYAKLCTQKLLEVVTEGHDVKDWTKTDAILSNYFKLYLKVLGLRILRSNLRS